MDEYKGMSWVVLDMDGTLINLGVDWNRVKLSIKNYFSDKGIDIEPTPLHTKLEEAIAKSEDPVVTRKEAQDILTKEEERGLPRLINGSRELVSGFKERGYKIVIFTSNDRKVAEELLNKFNLQADKIVGRVEGVPSKPHHLAIEVLKKEISSEEIVAVVGDSWADEKVAKSLGVTFFKVGEADLKSQARQIMENL